MTIAGGRNKPCTLQPRIPACSVDGIVVCIFIIAGGTVGVASFTRLGVGGVVVIRPLVVLNVALVRHVVVFRRVSLNRACVVFDGTERFHVGGFVSTSRFVARVLEDLGLIVRCPVRLARDSGMQAACELLDGVWERVDLVSEREVSRLTPTPPRCPMPLPWCSI